MIEQIVGKGIKVRHWMRQIITVGVAKLSKYFPHLSPDNQFIRIVVGKHPVKRYKVRLQVKLPKKNLFAQEQGDRLRTVVNETVDDMRRQLKKYRDKLREFKK